MTAQTLTRKVTLWSAATLGRALWALVKVLARPTIGVPVLVLMLLASWVGQHGPAPALLTLAAIITGLVVWRWQHRSSYTRLVGVRLLAIWGRVRYGLVWRFWMGRLGLALDDERTGKSVRPQLVKVRATADTDSLLVSLPTGFKPADLREKLDDLATAARVGEVRLRRDRPGRVWIDLLTRDPLAKTVPALPVPDIADPAALSTGVQVGVTSAGAPWLMRLVGNSILIGGVSGAGKASVFWAIVRAIAPHVRDGYVRLIGLDPKGGMELAWGRNLFTRLCDGALSDMADVLEAQVAEMHERALRMAGKSRSFVPSLTVPLVVIIADELLILTSLAPRSARREADRIETALAALLVEGRAVGYCVIGATQDVRADKMTLRDFFLSRVALRLSTESQPDMLLGDGARAAGAYADRISDTTPGIAYVRESATGDPIRVRAAFVTDDDLVDMNTRYRAPGALRSVPDSTTDENTAGEDVA